MQNSAIHYWMLLEILKGLLHIKMIWVAFSRMKVGVEKNTEIFTLYPDQNVNEVKLKENYLITFFFF